MLRWILWRAIKTRPATDAPRWKHWLFRHFSLQLALHQILRSDDDRALHDHVGWNVSIILRGWYLEVTPEYSAGKLCGGPLTRRVIFRRAATPHRLMLLDDRPVWSLWLRGPSVREWGFHCPKGWRHWKDYVSQSGYHEKGSVSTIGKGCDD